MNSDECHCNQTKSNQSALCFFFISCSCLKSRTYFPPESGKLSERARDLKPVRQNQVATPSWGVDLLRAYQSDCTADSWTVKHSAVSRIKPSNNAGTAAVL